MTTKKERMLVNLLHFLGRSDVRWRAYRHRTTSRTTFSCYPNDHSALIQNATRLSVSSLCNVALLIWCETSVTAGHWPVPMRPWCPRRSSKAYLSRSVLRPCSNLTTRQAKYNLWTAVHHHEGVRAPERSFRSRRRILTQEIGGDVPAAPFCLSSCPSL